MVTRNFINQLVFHQLVLLPVWRHAIICIDGNCFQLDLWELTSIKFIINVQKKGLGKCISNGSGFVQVSVCLKKLAVILSKFLCVWKLIKMLLKLLPCMWLYFTAFQSFKTIHKSFIQFYNQVSRLWLPLRFFKICFWHLNFMMNDSVFIPLAQQSCWGGILVSLRPSVCRSVRPSVPRPSRIPCPLCSFYSSGWTHFIFMHLIKQLEKVCRVQSFLQNFKIWNFDNFFEICNFDFALFWLGIWCESLVWVIMGWRGYLRTQAF